MGQESAPYESSAHSAPGLPVQARLRSHRLQADQAIGMRDCVILNLEATNAKSVNVALPAGLRPVT